MVPSIPLYPSLLVVKMQEDILETFIRSVSSFEGYIPKTANSPHVGIGFNSPSEVIAFATKLVSDLSSVEDGGTFSGRCRRVLAKIDEMDLKAGDECPLELEARIHAINTTSKMLKKDVVNLNKEKKEILECLSKTCTENLTRVSDVDDCMVDMSPINDMTSKIKTLEASISSALSKISKNEEIVASIRDGSSSMKSKRSALLLELKTLIEREL